MKPRSSSIWLICSLCVNAVLAYPTNLTSNDTTAHYRRPAFQTCIEPATEWWPTTIPTAEVLGSDCENALFQMVDLQETYGDEVSCLKSPIPLDAKSVVNHIADPHSRAISSTKAQTPTPRSSTRNTAAVSPSDLRCPRSLATDPARLQ